MYVFVDMEWISNQRGNHWPTQLAAARVDAHWNTVDTLSTLFRPKDFSFQQWGHMAFSGWNKEQFLNGESLYAGLDAFRHWLQPEDTEQWLDTIESRLHYERWYCGHYHTDKEIDKIRFMFQDYALLPHQISLSAEKEMIRRMQRQAEIVEALGLMDEAQEEK